MIHPIDSYSLLYYNIARFQQLHVRAAFITIVAGSLIAALAFLALSKGVLPLDLSTSGYVLAAVMGSATLSGLAIAGILLHYACKISKIEKVSEEALYNALSHPDSANLFDSETENNKKTAQRFRFMLDMHFSDAHWEEMMRYLDTKFFNNPEIVYGDALIAQVYDLILKADPIRFLVSFYEMQERKALSQKCIDFLNHQGLSIDILAEQWDKIIIEANQSYLSRHTYTHEDLKLSLLTEMAEVNPEKFFNSYLKVKKILSQHFQKQIEEKLIYQENIMKAAWTQLFNLNKIYFIIKYLDLRFSGKFKSSDLDDEIRSILEKQNYEDWAKLLIAIDAIYFRQQNPKEEILDVLIEIDKNKLGEAYNALYFDLSSALKEKIAEKIPELKNKKFIKKLI